LPSRHPRPKGKRKTPIVGTSSNIESDAIRWLHRVGYHLWRIQHHMNRMREAGAPASALREAAVEVLQD